MQTTTNRKPRQSKPLAPVCGTVKLLQPIGSVGKPEQQTGEISINGKPYYCRCLSGCYQLFGFDAKKNQPTHYDIAPDLSSCDCADATYRNERPEGCKHVKALKALIAAGKLPAIAGQVEDKAARQDADLCITDEQADELYADYLAETCR